MLQDVGIEGQQKILDGKVLIIGMGGLGAPAALYLAAAGVGTIGLVDEDVVDTSNLQRQVIHFTPDVGKPKILSAKEKMDLLTGENSIVVNMPGVVHTQNKDQESFNVLFMSLDFPEPKEFVLRLMFVDPEPFRREQPGQD